MDSVVIENDEDFYVRCVRIVCGVRGYLNSVAPLASDAISKFHGKRVTTQQDIVKKSVLSALPALRNDNEICAYYYATRTGVGISARSPWSYMNGEYSCSICIGAICNGLLVVSEPIKPLRVDYKVEDVRAAFEKVERLEAELRQARERIYPFDTIKW